MSSFEFLRINSGGYRTIKKRDKMSKGMKAIPIHELQKKHDVRIATIVDDNDQVKARRCKASVLFQSHIYKSSIGDQ